MGCKTGHLLGSKCGNPWKTSFRVVGVTLGTRTGHLPNKVTSVSGLASWTFTLMLRDKHETAGLIKVPEQSVLWVRSWICGFMKRRLLDQRNYCKTVQEDLWTRWLGSNWQCKSAIKKVVTIAFQRTKFLFLSLTEFTVSRCFQHEIPLIILKFLATQIVLKRQSFCVYTIPSDVSVE